MNTWLDEIFIPAVRARQSGPVPLNRSGERFEPNRSYDPVVDPLNTQDTDDCMADTMRYLHSNRSCVREREQSGPVAGPSWIENPRTREERDQIRQDRCYAELLREAEYTCRDRPEALALFDSWAGQQGRAFRAKLSENQIVTLQIPPHTTGQLQPLGVGFFRQYKIIMSRLMDAARLDGLIDQVIIRYGIINLNSLIYNQLQARAYRDQNRYAWRKTDSRFSADELESGDTPATANNVNFGFRRNHICEVEGCTHTARIQCSHCGTFLCTKHFLERVCFHTESNEDDARDIDDELFNQDHQEPGRGSPHDELA